MPPEAARTAEPGPESVNRPVRPVPPALLSPGTGPKNQTPAAPQTSTQTPNAGQEQAAQEPKPSSAVGGINHSVDQRTSHTGAEAKLNRGRAEKKSDHGSAPFPPVPSGCNSREWQRGNDAVHPLPPWWRVAHPVHLLPCCCPAHLTRAEARMAPPMIIGMKSRSPHLDGCGSVERRSPRNTRVDPTRMGGGSRLDDEIRRA